MWGCGLANWAAARCSMSWRCSGWGKRRPVLRGGLCMSSWIVSPISRWRSLTACGARCMGCWFKSSCSADQSPFTTPPDWGEGGCGSGGSRFLRFIELVVDPDDALANGEQDQAGDVVDAQAVHDLRAMRFDGFHAQAQARSDGTGGFAPGDQAQDFQLSCGQGNVGFERLLAVLFDGLIDHQWHHCRAQVLPAMADRLERQFKFDHGGALEQVAVGAQLQALHHEIRVGVHR